MTAALRHAHHPLALWLLWAFVAAGSAAAAPTVVATATSGAVALDLDGEGSATEHVVKVADLTLETLNQHGLSVSISSGGLTKSGGSSIPFQVTTVPSGAAPPGSGSFTVASGGTYVFETDVAGSTARDLYLRYTPAALQDPGTYGASVSLSVMDNP